MARYASPEHRKMRALSEGAATLVPAHSDEGGSADEAENVSALSGRPKEAVQDTVVMHDE
ncbi:hypothetical protein KSC_073470 [Ktedonobacter sp. SOSP1-52]|uniref:hypothetical protein n=1 Tax=Ktedonobacter sp. SOSP1-52 TaxID=2778366 RepID=UPI001915B1FE|nr:hypothetical protein [Ktedonobacter sp. SOSP1-52]GHO68455.1 hypothetical protein KSC_073470 [Ktedonobacter sp. SOSP1-52]